MSTKLVASPKSGAFWRERRKEQQWRQAAPASGSSSRVHSSTAFHLPKLALGRVCVDGADGVGGGRQWTRSGPPLPPRPACCAVCLRRHCLAAAMCPAASVQPPAAPHYVLCQAPSYSIAADWLASRYHLWLWSIAQWSEYLGQDMVYNIYVYF